MGEPRTGKDNPKAGTHRNLGSLGLGVKTSVLPATVLPPVSQASLDPPVQAAWERWDPGAGGGRWARLPSFKPGSTTDQLLALGKLQSLLCLCLLICSCLMGV